MRLIYELPTKSLKKILKFKKLFLVFNQASLILIFSQIEKNLSSSLFFFKTKNALLHFFFRTFFSKSSLQFSKTLLLPMLFKSSLLLGLTNAKDFTFSISQLLENSDKKFLGCFFFKQYFFSLANLNFFFLVRISLLTKNLLFFLQLQFLYFFAFMSRNVLKIFLLFLRQHFGVTL